VGRTIWRLSATGTLAPAQVAAAREIFDRAVATWWLVGVGPEVLDRAGRSFPSEPLRTLDAIHLASAGAALGLADDPAAGLVVLSTDLRVRANAAALGFAIAP
jgi:hypothetical protein